MFRILLIAIIFILIVRFIIRFVMPVFQITRAAQNKMKEMQRQMEQMPQNEQQPRNNPSKKPIEGDYIDYEEVK